MSGIFLGLAVPLLVAGIWSGGSQILPVVPDIWPHILPVLSSARLDPQGDPSLEYAVAGVRRFGHPSNFFGVCWAQRDRVGSLPNQLSVYLR